MTVTIYDYSAATMISRRDVTGICDMIVTLADLRRLGFTEYFTAPVTTALTNGNVTVVIQH